MQVRWSGVVVNDQRDADGFTCLHVGGLNGFGIRAGGESKCGSQRACAHQQQDGESCLAGTSNHVREWSHSAILQGIRMEAEPFLPQTSSYAATLCWMGFWS